MPRISSPILIFITGLVFMASTSYAANAQDVAQDVVTKSPIDQKLYRYLELDNRLKVLLISDSETDKSAAALDVYVGSGSDPKGWPGLAHFLEHMLFLGTKKYPTTGEYQAFINNNGGNNNAFTSFSHTNYYFSIAADHFEPALDRFSRFFIDPTFDEVYVARERSIIHSEYQARKKDEHRRLWDVQKQWLNKDHPFSRFAVGSMETLRDREEASARETLIKFYNQYYSANIMALTVLGKESLDQLEQMVSDRFSQIPDRGVAPPLFTQQYMDAELMPVRLNSIPEKQQNSARFVFPIPSTYQEYRSKPLDYIANLLGHEGTGSLHSLLKDRGWVESLSAGAGYMDQAQGEFSIWINLTKAGVNHIEDIGNLVFQTIDLIKQKEIDEWRFQEQSKLAKIAFRFEQERDPGRLVQSLAFRLQRYPAKDVLQGPYLMESFTPNRTKTLLDYLNPDNVNLHVSSQSLAQSLGTDKISEYYDVAYSLAPIEPETLNLWKTKIAHESLQLPAENPFIPERLDLLEIDSEQKAPEKISAAQLSTAAGVTLWYQPDNQFSTPRANFYFNIMSPLANSSTENLVLTELYVRLVNSQLNKIIYPAYLADLNYSLYRHARGISVRISGFEDKQSEFLSIIIDALENPEYDEDRFNVIKAGLLRELGNISKDSPSTQVVHEIYRLLMRPYWTEQERIAALNSVTIDDVEKFVPELFNQVTVNVLSHGDVSLEDSIARSEMLDELLKNSVFINPIEKPKIRKLDRAKRYLRSLDIDHSDSALAAYFQGNDDSRIERAKVSLLKHLLEPSFYNQLRTVNRVGYIVHASTLKIDQTPGLLFSVQSPSHSPVEINKLYDAFISDFSETLDEMSEPQFDQLKSGLAAKILRKDKNLSARSQRYWREIDLEEYQFDSRQQFADAVTTLTLQDMQTYYKNHIVNRAGELLVQSWGADVDIGMGRIPSQSYVETADATRFRQSFQ